MGSTTYHVNEAFSLACLTENCYQNAQDTYPRLARMILNSQWHFYRVVGNYQLYSVKKNSDQEAEGTVPHRLFFMVRPAQSEVIILHYFSVSQNEHEESKHFQKFERGLRLVLNAESAASFKAKPSTVRVNNKAGIDEQLDMSSAAKPQDNQEWHEDVKKRLDSIDTQKLSSANIHRVIAITCEVYNRFYKNKESDQISIEKNTIFDMVLRKLTGYLNSDIANIYLSRVRGSLILHVQLGNGREQLFELTVRNSKSFFTILITQLAAIFAEKSLPKTHLHGFIFQSIDTDVPLVLEKMQSCSDANMPTNKRVINNIIDKFVVKKQLNEVERQCLLQFIRVLLDEKIIKHINIDNLNAIINVILAYYVKEDSKIEKKLINSLLNACMAHIRVQHLEKILSCDKTSVNIDSVFSLLNKIEWQINSRFLDALLKWCNYLDKEKDEKKCKNILSKLIERYKILAAVEQYSLSSWLNSYANLFKEYSLSIPEIPQLQCQSATPANTINAPRGSKRTKNAPRGSKRTKGKNRGKASVGVNSIPQVSQANEATYEALEEMHEKYLADLETNKGKFLTLTNKKREFIIAVSREVNKLCQDGKIVFPSEEFRSKFIQTFIIDRPYEERLYGRDKFCQLNIVELACLEGDLFLVATLGDMVNQYCDGGVVKNSPYALFCAAVEHKYSMVIFLLNKFGYDPNGMSSENLLPLLALFYKLFRHSKQNDPSKLINVINKLIQHGADINCTDESGNAILKLALCYPNVVIETLLRLGANPNAVCTTETNEIFSVLDYAMGTKDVSKATQKLLEEYGAQHFSGPMHLPIFSEKDGQLVTIYGNAQEMQRKRQVAKSTIDNLLKKEGKLTDEQKQQLWKTIAEFPYSLNMLIPISVDDKASKKNSLSILFVLFMKCEFDFISKLIQTYKINLNLKCDVILREGKLKLNGTLLHLCCGLFGTPKMNLTMARMLIEYGASITEYDKDGLVPIHVAAMKKAYEVLDVLISHGDPNVMTKEGKTLLHLCAESNNPRMAVHVLAGLSPLDRRFQLNTEDVHGRLPKDYTKDDGFTRLLSAFDPDTPFPKNEGTLLHAEAANHNADMLEVLLDHLSTERLNTLLNTTDENGNYPLDLAIAANLSVNIALLEQKNAPRRQAIACSSISDTAMGMTVSHDEITNVNSTNSKQQSDTADTSEFLWRMQGSVSKLQAGTSGYTVRQEMVERMNHASRMDPSF